MSEPLIFTLTDPAGGPVLPSLPLREAVVLREFPRQATLRLLAPLNDRLLENLAAAIDEQPLLVNVRAAGVPLLDTPALVRGAGLRAGMLVELEASFCGLPLLAAMGKARSEPRRRVLAAENLLVLVEQLAPLVETPKIIASHLEKIASPSGPQAFVVQDGLDDEQFLERILIQVAWPEAAEACWFPLGLVAGTENKWSLAWNSAEPYEEAGDVKLRTFAPKGSIRWKLDDDRFRRPQREIQHAGFDPAAWREQARSEFPRFSPDGRYIDSILQRVYLAGNNHLGWTTRYTTLLPGVRAPVPAQPLPVFLGGGEVTRQIDRLWFEVRLEGFEPGADTASVKVLTPYTGKNSEEGIVVEPEPGARVWVGRSGRFTDPLVFLGDERCRPPRLEALGLDFDSLALRAAATIDIQCDKLEAAAGNVDIGATQEMKIHSQGPTTLQGEQARLRLAAKNVECNP